MMKIEYFSAAVRLYAPTIVLFAKWLRARFQQLARVGKRGDGRMAGWRRPAARAAV